MVSGYTPVYDANEIDEPIIDLLVGSIGQTTDFSTIIGLGLALAIIVAVFGYAGIRLWHKR